MGKKGVGRKAFVKSTMVRPADADVEDPKVPSDNPSEAPQAGAATPSIPEADVSKLVDKAAKFRIDEPSTSDTPSGANDASTPQHENESKGEEDSDPRETRGQMVQRHKMEAKGLKEQVKKLGKKKKDEAAKLEKDMEERHTAELKAWDAAHALESESGKKGGQDAKPGKTSGKTMTRAQKRREQRAAEDAEREERIARELAEGGDSSRLIEERELRQRLAPEGLAKYDIPADGHCMYRAIEHQLGPGQKTYLELRSEAATYIRAHPDDFISYLAEEDETDEEQQQNDGESAEDINASRLERYCERVEGTAAWGGQIELQALACALKRGIRVYSAHMGVVDVGSEYTDAPPLKVCYFQHAYGLGEHYNSVKPLEGSETGSDDES